MTPEQSRKLRQFYLKLYQLYQKNLDVSEDIRRRGGPSNVPKKDRADQSDQDPENVIPNDDLAKDDVKHQEELREMEDFLTTYGGDYLRTSLYDMSKVGWIDAILFLHSV